MDDFAYSLRSAEIDTFKTLKVKEAFLREIIANLVSNSWYYSVDEKDMNAAANTYKCISKTLLNYDSARLPATINRTIVNIETSLIDMFCKTSCSYKLFIDTFQFNSIITIRSGNRYKIAQLAEIFKDNPIPFTIQYNASPDSKYSAVLDDLEKLLPAEHSNTIASYYPIGVIVQIEELKRSLPSNITYTIIEDMLTKLYTSLEFKEATAAEFSEVYITDMENLLTVAHTVTTRLLNEHP